MEFVNRTSEIATLERLLSGPDPALVRVYGRRRLGKTELLKRVCERGGGSYLLIEDADPGQVLASLTKQVAEATHGLALPYRDWDAFFRALPGLGVPFVVLDEFQNVVENDRFAVSRLQAHWDTTLRKTGPSLVLCGSSVGMMQRITEGRKGPLFGRLSGDLRIRPFRYPAVRLLYPDLGEEERVRRFAVFGGTPHYHHSSVGRPRREAVIGSFLEAGSPFQEEPQSLLRLELKAPVRYNSILYEIGRGTHALRDLESKVGVPKGGLGPYLDLLKADLDLIRMEDPVCGKQRQARYVFADPFFEFYYRFVFENRPRIELDRQAQIWLDIEKAMDHYVGPHFEQVAQDVLRVLNGTQWHGVPIDFDEIGRWWNRIGEEIDIVAPGRKEALVGEVEWTNDKVDVQALDALMAKAGHIEHLGDRAVRPFVVSKSGVTVSAENWLHEHHGFALQLGDIERICQEHDAKGT